VSIDPGTSIHARDDSDVARIMMHWPAVNMWFAAAQVDKLHLSSDRSRDREMPQEMLLIG
jgi:hypothetical protein